MDARIFAAILPILGILAVRMTDIQTRHPKKNTETDGRTRQYKKNHGRKWTAFRNSVAISNNHIAYLEAHLETLSLLEGEKKVDDEFEGKGAKVWKELGCESQQLTIPPLTPMMPSTSQQADTADSVASMVKKHQGSSMSAGVDQWSMLGLGQDQKTEEKDKQGLGKIEDKGKVSPQRTVQLGVASSAGFIQVPPPISPRMGGAAPGAVPAVGGAGGHMKLEPPAKFTGKGFPTVGTGLKRLQTGWSCPHALQTNGSISLVLGWRRVLVAGSGRRRPISAQVTRHPERTGGSSLGK